MSVQQVFTNQAEVAGSVLSPGGIVVNKLDPDG